tara:strand:+ start:100 stop:936 length:837 start_codon:yes stop_codon:yes gene_type:complete
MSLRSEKFNENFHSLAGAYNETKNKFINPSRLKRFQNKSINVLDICFGIGYNSSLLFENLIKESSTLNWYGLELDKRPLNYALNDKNFIHLWSPKVIEILNSLYLKGLFKNKNFDCKLIIGDARKTILKIPTEINFDLIFLDGFSPQKCPEIWSNEFLSQLKNKIKNEGYLITYTSSAAVRKSLKNIGFSLFNVIPTFSEKNRWSNGTLATFDKRPNNLYITQLSEMEIEHLNTKASIPYRDPTGEMLSKEILKNRKKEQQFSNLLGTNSWRKKWGMA